MSQECTLCQIELPRNPVVDGEDAFCCPGCHAVHKILSNQESIGDIHEHPVFQQAVRAGLISNPDLLEEVRVRNAELVEEETQSFHLEVSEMWCPSCAEIIKLMLLREQGVKHCVVDYSTDLASVEFAPKYLSKEKILQIITSLGYHAQPLEDARRPAVSRQLYLRLGVAAMCWLNIMMFAYPLYVADYYATPSAHAATFAWMSLLAALPVLGYSAKPIIRRFFSSLRVGLFGMETLVLLGVASAFGLSVYQLLQGSTHVYFDSMSAIIVFVLLGKVIEAKAKFSARESLVRLSRALPRKGRKRFEDGREDFVPIKEIRPGDLLMVCMGEKVVLDGLVMEGEGACDESLMTGESVPVAKQVGSPVLGGAILKQGNVVVQVTSSAEESALQRIVNMVEGDLQHKTAYVRAADQVVQWFVPTVLVLAIAAALWVVFVAGAAPGKTLSESAVLRAVSVLLISCPCALGIAAPLAESLLMSGLAQLGAIVRNRGCLRILGKESCLVVDKTGTVTEGIFRVLEGLSSLDDDSRRVLKGMSARSNHPVSCAISQAIPQRGLSLDNVIEHTGQGLSCDVDGKVYRLGSRDFLQAHGVEIPALPDPQCAYEGVVSLVYFAVGSQLLGRLALGDQLREESAEVIRELAELKPVLLSGDSREAVQAVAQACGFQQSHWRCRPEQKREVVEALRQQGETVCMLGDGINDAPALAAAHLGISVVSATDMSIQVSDILLTTDKLSVLPKLRRLALRGQRIVKQNLFWAFAYNVVGMGLAVSGLLQPLFAAFAMVTSSLFVLFNTLRLKS